MRNRLAPSLLSLLLMLAGAVALAEPKTEPAAPEPAAAANPEDPEAARRAEVIARFEGGQITVGELEDAVAAQSPALQQRFSDRAALKGLLDKSVRFELLAAEAQRRGFDKNDAVVFSLKQNAVQAMIKREFDEKITAESIPAADVQKYYDENIAEFVRPETRRASQILVATLADAQALLPQAKAADMRAFRELARQKSQDEASKQRGGDLRYFDAQGRVHDETSELVDPESAKAVFKLAHVGDTSAPVKVPAGYAILKLTGQRQAFSESVQQAEERIRMRLWRERRQAGIDALLAQLKEQHKPEIHPELVDAIKFDSAAPLPPTQGLPPGFPQAKPAAEAPAR